MEGTHAGEVPEELQAVRRTHIGEVQGGLSPVGSTGAGEECEQSSPEEEGAAETMYDQLTATPTLHPPDLLERRRSLWFALLSTKKLPLKTPGHTPSTAGALPK